MEAGQGMGVTHKPVVKKCNEWRVAATLARMAAGGCQVVALGSVASALAMAIGAACPLLETADAARAKEEDN